MNIVRQSVRDSTTRRCAPTRLPQARPGSNGAQHRRLRQVAALLQLEQEQNRDVAHVLGEPLVDDEGVVASVLPENLAVRVLDGGEFVTPHEQVEHADVARAAPHAAGLFRQAAA